MAERASSSRRNLIVATKFLKEHPDVVQDLIKGEDQAIKFINDNPADAQKVDERRHRQASPASR